MAKYERYAEYKDSGVEWLGEIPKDWEVIRLKYIAELSGNKISNSESQYVGLENVESKTGKFKVTEGIVSEGVSNTFEKGNLLFGKLRPYLAKSWLASFSGICSSEFLVLDSKLVHPKFLKYMTLTDEFVEQVNSSTYGTKMPRASWDFIGLLPLPVMNYDLSKIIANFLDHETAQIDTLIEKQQTLIQLLKEKRQAVISHAMTKGLNPDAPMKDSGVEWLGEVPEHWEVCRIKDLSSIISKGTTPSTMGGELIDEGIRFLKAENVGKSEYVKLTPEFYISQQVNEQLGRSKLEENDVLVIIAGATTGMASILQKELLPCNTNQAVSFIRPKNYTYSKWIAKWLSTEFSQRIIWTGAVQAAQPNLSMESLGNIPITLPISTEVTAIINFIDNKLIEFDRLILKAEQAIQLMQERRTALISAAVTGKIDVRGWQAPAVEAL